MPPSGAAHRFALASLGGGPRPAFALAVGAPAPSARPPLALLAPLRGYGRAVSFWQAAPAKPAIGAFAPFAGTVVSLPFAGSACQKAVFFGLRTACIMKSSVSPRPDVVTLPSFFGQLPWGPSVRFHDAEIKVSFAHIPSFISCRPSVGTSLLAWATFGFAISHARLESWSGLRVSCRSSRSLRGLAPPRSLIATSSSSNLSRGFAPNPTPCGLCLLVRTGAAPPNPC